MCYIHLLRNINMRNVIYTLLLLSLGCQSEPSKQEALEYYKSIVVESIPNRKVQRQLSDDILLYMKNCLETNHGRTDSDTIANFSIRNNALIQDFEHAKESLISVANFNGKSVLKDKAMETIDALTTTHKVSFTHLLETMSDGQVSKKDLEDFHKFRTDCEQLLAKYKEWKATRNEFCHEYNLTKADIEEFVK